MKWPVERTVIAGFWLALVILIAVGVVSYQSTLSWVVFSGSALAVFVVLAALAVIRRGLNDRQRAEAALQAAHDALDAKVQESTRSLRMLSECNQALVRATDEAGLLTEVCRNIVQFGGYRLAWVGFAEPDEARTIRPVAQAGADHGYLAALDLTWADTERGRGPSGSAIRAGKPVIARNILTDPAFAPWREQAARRGYVSSIALPFGANGRPLGVLNVYAAAPEAFEQAEVELLQELAQDVAYGLATLRTRAALRQSDALLRDTSRMAQVGGWELDLTTQALYWSEETYRIHEVDPSVQPDLASAINFYAPEARPVITEAVQKAAADGTPWDFELPFITATGRRLWVRAQGQAEFREGRGVRLWGAFQDITERKRAADALRQSDQKFSIIFEKAAFAAALSSLPDGGIVDVNEAWVKMSGYTKLEMVGKTTLELGINPNTEARARIIAQLQATGSARDQELTLRMKSGEMRVLSANVDLVEIGGQKYILNTVQDITDRKQAEEKIRRNTVRAEALSRISKALAEVSTNYRVVLDTTARLLSELIGDGCVVYLAVRGNPFFDPAALHHRNPEAETALRDLLAVTPARVGEGLVGRVHQTGQAVLIPQTTREQLRAAVQPDFWDYIDRFTIHSALEVPLRAEGRPLGVVVMFRNTPDHPYTAEDQAFLEEVADRAALVIANASLYAELEQRVAERTQALEAANKELEAFSYSVSHDLRAPLRALDGFSQILLEDYAAQVDATGRDYLQRVRTASQKMAELIDALLTLARLTRAEMRREPVDLSALARAVMAELQAHDLAREATVVIATGLSAEGDPRLLRAVLENLLGNAWKFTAKTPNARIEFGCQALDPGALRPDKPDEAVFFVRDNGAGFDMAHADKLFLAFQRLHGQAEFAGTGIGLATVQRVLHRHGGHAWAEGQVGRGATFYFTLRAASQSVPAFGHASLAPAESGTEQGQAGQS